MLQRKWKKSSSTQNSGGERDRNTTLFPDVAIDAGKYEFLGLSSHPTGSEGEGLGKWWEMTRIPKAVDAASIALKLVITSITTLAAADLAHTANFNCHSKHLPACIGGGLQLLNGTMVS